MQAEIFIVSQGYFANIPSLEFDLFFSWMSHF